MKLSNELKGWITGGMGWSELKVLDKTRRKMSFEREAPNSFKDQWKRTAL